MKSSARVMKIFSICMHVIKAEFNFTRRTAVKYPERQEQTATGMSDRDIARRDISHLESQSRSSDIYGERKNRKTDAMDADTVQKISAALADFTARDGSFFPRASDTRRVTPRFTPHAATVIKNPYTPIIREYSPIATLPAFDSTYILNATPIPRIMIADVQSDTVFKKKRRVLDAISKSPLFDIYKYMRRRR